jgi:hypothetical protein
MATPNGSPSGPRSDWILWLLAYLLTALAVIGALGLIALFWWMALAEAFPPGGPR